MLKDYTDNPILVTGAARSGTSMVAACIYLCGAWKGDTIGPNKWNAKGMFENHTLRQGIIKPLLRRHGVDPLGQYPLLKTKDIRIPVNFKENVVGTIKKQGYTEEKHWMYKCAKMTMLWPVWKHAFPRSKWIIVRRKDQDIVDSCLKTGFMNAFSREDVLKEIGLEKEKDGWAWWVQQHKEKFIEIMNNGVNVKVVWPEKMVNGDYSEIKDAIEWLGLEWNGPAVIDFVDPKLWKARQNQK